MIKKTILVTLILLIMCQYVKSESILKIFNFAGWRIPEISRFQRDPLLKEIPGNDQPEIVIEHYVLKDQDKDYTIYNKISINRIQTTFSENIDSFERELVNSFDIILSKSDSTIRFYRIFSNSQSNALSYYRNQMDFKKYHLGFDGGLESGEDSFYYTLDYDNDGIFETKIWGDTSENDDPNKQINLILNDYLEKREKAQDQCTLKVLNLKRNWLKFIENPSNDTLKQVYEAFPEKEIGIWMKKVEQITLKVKSDGVVEESQNVYKSLEEWKGKSLFCEGKASKEEKLLLRHISENLHLISREFLYGNPYALLFTFKLYPVLSGNRGLKLDQMLVCFCLMQPEKFLKELKVHSNLIKVDQALDRTIGYENIGLLNNAKREIEILLKTIQCVKNSDLKDIKKECIDYLIRRQKDLNNN